MIKTQDAVPVILFLFFSTLVIAQNDFQDGYVVTNANDTLFGKVRDRKTGSFSEIYDKIRFKGKGLKKRFSPKNIKAYKIGNTRFISLSLNDEMKFFRIVSEGHVSHFIFEFQEQGEQLVQDIDYLQKDDNTPLIRVTQGLFGLKRKRLSNFFSDCPELVKKIQNKEFKYTSELVDFYNDWKSIQ